MPDPKCTYCGGFGINLAGVYCPVCQSKPPPPKQRRCPACKGHRGVRSCKTCKGTGKVEVAP